MSYTPTDDYGIAVQANNPVAWWRLAETSGPTAFNVGSLTGIDGTYGGGVTLGSTPLVPTSGLPSAYFDGTGNVRLPTVPATEPANNFSIEAVIEVIGSNPYQAIYSVADGGVYLRMNSGNVALLKSAQAYYGASTGALALSTVYHLLVTISTNEARFYLNGALSGVVSNTYNFPVAGSGYGILIAQDRGGENFTGNIAEVAVYDYVLTASDAAAHFAAMSVVPDTVRVEVSQFNAEVMSVSVARAIVSQFNAEVMYTQASTANISQFVMEVLGRESRAIVTQFNAEVMLPYFQTISGERRINQVVVEVLTYECPLDSGATGDPSCVYDVPGHYWYEVGNDTFGSWRNRNTALLDLGVWGGAFPLSGYMGSSFGPTGTGKNEFDVQPNVIYNLYFTSNSNSQPYCWNGAYYYAITSIASAQCGAAPQPTAAACTPCSTAVVTTCTYSKFDTVNVNEPIIFSNGDRTATRGAFTTGTTPRAYGDMLVYGDSVNSHTPEAGYCVEFTIDNLSASQLRVELSHYASFVPAILLSYATDGTYFFAVDKTHTANNSPGPALTVGHKIAIVVYCNNGDHGSVGSLVHAAIFVEGVLIDFGQVASSSVAPPLVYSVSFDADAQQVTIETDIEAMAHKSVYKAYRETGIPMLDAGEWGMCTSSTAPSSSMDCGPKVNVDQMMVEVLASLSPTMPPGVIVQQIVQELLVSSELTYLKGGVS